MSGRRRQTLVAAPVDAEAPLSLGQLCRVLDIDADHVIEMVEVGVVEPVGGRRPSEWHFPAHALWRLRRALRLRHDLAVDPAGAALALDLLEELQALRARVRALETGRDTD